MEGTSGHDAQENKSDRERQILYHLTYMLNLKKTPKKTPHETHRKRDQICGYQRRWGGGGEELEGSGQNVH